MVSHSEQRTSLMIFQNRVLRICRSKKEELTELRKLHAKDLLTLNYSENIINGIQ
jgi:hypothetical protein